MPDFKIDQSKDTVENPNQRITAAVEPDMNTASETNDDVKSIGNGLNTTEFIDHIAPQEQPVKKDNDNSIHTGEKDNSIHTAEKNDSSQIKKQTTQPTPSPIGNNKESDGDDYPEGFKSKIQDVLITIEAEVKAMKADTKAYGAGGYKDDYHVAKDIRFSYGKYNQLEGKIIITIDRMNHVKFIYISAENFPEKRCSNLGETVDILREIILNSSNRKS